LPRAVQHGKGHHLNTEYGQQAYDLTDVIERLDVDADRVASGITNGNWTAVWRILGELPMRHAHGVIARVVDLIDEDNRNRFTAHLIAWADGAKRG
jgi:hypothetical protein